MIAYLDNSATTRPSESVIAAMEESMRGGYFNPSSLYAPALAAEKAMNACRKKIEAAISAPEGHVYFTSGGTEANNLAILGAASAFRAPGHAIVTAVEHPSVLAAYERLGEKGWRVTVLPVDKDGQPDWAALDQALADPPALVSCMQVNNETGALPDIARLVKAVREKAPDALIHVDGVQGFLRVPFDARLCDLYTLSGHKLHGPKGVGALWVRKGVRLKPRQLGGGQEDAIRSGTENTPGIAGLRAAIETMPHDAGEITARLKARLLAGLCEGIPGLIVNSPKTAAGHILNVGFPRVRGEVMLHALEGEGVYASTGSACSSKKRKVSPVLLAMGVKPDVAEWALRLSLSPFTTEAEIDYAIEKAGKLYAVLSRYQRR